LEEQYQQAQKMEAVGRWRRRGDDFNNLLTVISRLLRAVAVRFQAGRSHQADIADSEAGARAGGLTGHYLAFSRKQIHLSRTLLDLNQIATDMRADARTPHRRGREGRARPSARAGAGEGDRGQVEQVVMNP